MSRFLLAFGIRGLALWCMVRAVGWYLIGDDAIGAFWAAVVTLLLIAVDVRRGNERILFGNLGVSVSQLAAIGVAICIACEFALQSVVIVFLCQHA